MSLEEVFSQQQEGATLVKGSLDFLTETSNFFYVMLVTLFFGRQKQISPHHREGW